MHVAEAEVKTKKATAYLVQLCKHFAHKTQAYYGESQGRVEFQPGLCVMHVAGDRLSLRCEADSEPDLHAVKAIVADHLVRFAWREKITVAWCDVAPVEPRN